MGIESKLTPRIIRAFFIVGLQRFFEHHPEYPWNEDDAKSKIFIQEDMAEDSRYEDILPAVIVDGDGAVYNEEGIGNVLHLPQITPHMRKIVSQFTVRSALTLHCMAESSIEAEELACQVAIIMITLRGYARDIFQIQFAGMPRQSKPSPIKKEGWDGTYDCSVSFEFHYAVRTEVTPIDPGVLLKSIELSLVGPDYPNGGAPNSVNNGSTGSTGSGSGTPNDQTTVTQPGEIDPSYPGHNSDGTTNPTYPHSPSDPTTVVSTDEFGRWTYIRMSITNDSIEETQANSV